MKKIFLLTFVMFSLGCIAQENELAIASDWKLYDLEIRTAFNIPVDSLKYCKSIKLDSFTISDFVRKAYLLPEKENYVWMGAYLVSCKTLKGEIRKILISNYGGFFIDNKLKRVYELPQEFRREWLDYLNDKLTELKQRD